MLKIDKIEGKYFVFTDDVITLPREKFCMFWKEIIVSISEQINMILQITQTIFTLNYKSFLNPIRPGEIYPTSETPFNNIFPVYF